MPEPATEPISSALGTELRRARLERGLTLVDVNKRSRGRFKPSLLGAYERGERTISLPRLVELASIYQMPADVFIRRAQAAARAPASGVVIDLTKLSSLNSSEAHAAAEFIHRLRTQRGDYLSDVISLRAGDLETIAAGLGLLPKTLRTKLRPAERRPGSPPPVTRPR